MNFRIRFFGPQAEKRGMVTRSSCPALQSTSTSIGREVPRTARTSSGRPFPGRLRAAGRGSFCGLVLALGFRSFALYEPIVLNAFAQLDEVLEIGWLHHEGVGAKAVGFVHVADVIRRGQYYYAKLAEAGFVPDPAKDVKPIQARHFEIQ